MAYGKPNIVGKNLNNISEHYLMPIIHFVRYGLSAIIYKSQQGSSENYNSVGNADKCWALPMLSTTNAN